MEKKSSGFTQVRLKHYIVHWIFSVRASVCLSEGTKTSHDGCNCHMQPLNETEIQR